MSQDQNILLALYACVAGIILLFAYIWKEIRDRASRRRQPRLPFDKDRRSGADRREKDQDHEMASASR